MHPPKCQNIKASKPNCTKTHKLTTQSFFWSKRGAFFDIYHIISTSW